MVDTRPLSDGERLDWLCLSRSENVGPVTFLALLDRYGSAAAALEALPALARSGGRKRAIKLFSKTAAQREITELAELGGRFVAMHEPAYPAPLAALADPPPGPRLGLPVPLRPRHLDHALVAVALETRHGLVQGAEGAHPRAHVAAAGDHPFGALQGPRDQRPPQRIGIGNLAHIVAVHRNHHRPADLAPVFDRRQPVGIGQMRVNQIRRCAASSAPQRAEIAPPQPGKEQPAGKRQEARIADLKPVKHLARCNAAIGAPAPAARPGQRKWGG